MVMSLRVSELQVLLGYAGRNKHGRKHELLTKALHLLKAGCSPAVQMKIKELYRRRFPQKIMTPADLPIPSVHPNSIATLSPSTIPQLSYDGHPPTSPLLPVTLMGPKHELDLPHLTSALHPVHPDIKLQKLPFYDLLDELIKPTSLGKRLIIFIKLCKRYKEHICYFYTVLFLLRRKGVNSLPIPSRLIWWCNGLTRVGIRDSL